MGIGTWYPSPRHALAVGTTELRVGWRKVRSKGLAQQLALVVAALMGVAFAVGATAGAYFAGRELAAGNVDDPLAVGAYAPAGLWVMIAALGAYLTAVQIGDVDNRDGLLTTVPARDVVGGLFVGGLVRVTGIFVAPAAVATVGLAVGAGSPATFPLALAAVLGVGVGAFAVGFPVGLAVRYLLSRSAFVDRYKTWLGALAFAAYMLLLLTNSLGQVFGPAVLAMGESPVGWYAHLALLSVVDAADPVRGGVALAVAAALVVLSLPLSTRAAAMRWYADPVEADAPRTTESSRAGWLLGAVDRRTAWVTRKSWLRARRAPIKLIYVAYPLFALFAPVQETIATGRVPTTLPAMLALYGGWATGAAFTLNPLGDEGAVLPVTLTTPVRGRQFVRGLVLAGAIVGVPVTVAITLVTAVLSPLDPVAVLALVVAAAALAAAAPGLAVGVGMAFPKFEATSVTRSRKVVVPSAWGFLVYSLALLVLGAPSIGTQVPLVATGLAEVTGLATSTVRAGGVILSVALVAGAAWLSARHAADRFDEYAD